jgi:hypothetical protein
MTRNEPAAVRSPELLEDGALTGTVPARLLRVWRTK